MADEELQLTMQLRDQFSDELKRMITQIGQLEAALRDATNGTSGASTRDIEDLNRELGQAQDNSKSLSAAIDKLDRHVEELGDTANQSASKVNRLGTAGSKTSKGFSGLVAAGRGAAMGVTAAAAAAVVAAVGFAKLTTAVGQYQQNVIKSRQVFGSQTREMRKWSRRHRADFGGSTQDVLNYAASLQDLIVPMGFQRKEATGMTKDIAGLVPALTAWDRQGRSASEITDILAGSLTGERDALKGLGITISDSAVKAQIELMRSHGKLKGATDEQASAQATLALLYAKTGDAQKAYAKNSDTISRGTKNMTSDVKELRDQGLSVLLGTWKRVSTAMDDSGFGASLKGLVKWVRRHKDVITEWLLNIASAAVRLGGWALKLEGVWMRAFGGMLKGVGWLLRGMSFLDPRLKGAADSVQDMSETMYDGAAAADRAAEKMFSLSDALHDQANQATRVRDRLKAVGIQIDNLNAKKVKDFVGNNRIPGFNSQGGTTIGDTTTPMGAGPSLGTAGLLAAHRDYATSLGGHTVTSTVRGWNLGSARSDHLRGRAMDVTGPRLGSYAQAVRSAGGYAAFHGIGAGRHLHVVPHTNRPTVTAGGGDMFHSELHFHGADIRPFDARTAVISAHRDLARRRRERGGR